MSLTIVSGNSLPINYFNSVRFNTAAGAPTYAEGTVYWDATDHTLAVMPEVSTSTLQVGQENWVRILNKTGAQLNDGQVVYLSGAQGNRPTVALAVATSTNADRVIGICTADIANNAEGYVTTFGLVRGINTSGFAAGDTLYVSAATPGAITNVAPTAPNHAVRVGYALNSTVSGMLFVSTHAGSDLATLHDVLLTSPADKHALRYDFANTRWTNTAQAAWLDTAQTFTAAQALTGAGSYLGLETAQGAAPSTPAAGFRLYADASHRLAWKGQNGYVRVFDGVANTADRTYTLPDSTGTLALLSLAQTWSAQQTFSQPIISPTGTFALPAYSYTGQTSSGNLYASYSGLSSQWISVAGAPAMSIGSGGLHRVAYGSNPAVFLTRFQGSYGAETAVTSGIGLGQIGVRPYDGTTAIGSTTAAAYIQFSAAEDHTATAHGTYLSFVTTNVGLLTQPNRNRICAGGQLVWGNNTDALATYDSGLTASTPDLQMASIGANNTSFGIARFSSTSTNYPSFQFAKSAGAAVGTYTETVSGEVLGVFIGEGVGVAGTAFRRSTAIRFVQDAAAGSATIVPGRIEFQTARTSDGALTEALRIDSAQQVQVKAATASTSTTTGALVVSGGVGIAKEIYGGSSIVSTAPTAGIGYATGAGGTVTQTTSRTTGVTINKICGQITLVSAAGSASWQSFTVTNSAVAATDTVRVCQASGTDLYMCHVTAVAAGSFRVTFATTGGTTTEQPVFNFAIIKAVTA